MPGPSAWPFLAAVFTAGFFLLLTVKANAVAVISGVLAVVCVLRWLWETDRPMAEESVDIGAGIHVPTYVTGPSSHGWWAMVVLMLVLGMIFLMAVFSYVFLWSRNPGLWAPPPGLGWLAAVLGGYGVAGALALAAPQALRRLPETGRALAPMLVLLAAGALLGAFAADAGSWWGEGLRPDASGQGATVFAMISLEGLLLAVAVLMAGFVLARALRGHLSAARTSTVDVVCLFLAYTAGQGALGAVIVRLFPGGS